MHYVDAKSLLTRWNGINVYRGCTHGCVYCDSRSACYRFAHPFDDVEVKQNAPQLLEQILRGKRKECMIGFGSMSDPYQPCERELGLTRRCLELMDCYGFGATVITKSDLVLRDMDLFASIQKKSKAVVQVTLTMLDEALSRKLEPGVCDTRRRIEVLRAFQREGIPTVVWMTPLLPYLTDTRENVEGLMDACFDAGVKGIVCFGIGMTLREGNREYYYAALDRHFPGLSARYRQEFGNKYEVVSAHSDELMALFHRRCEAHGVLHTPEDCFRYTSELPEKNTQISIAEFIEGM